MSRSQVATEIHGFCIVRENPMVLGGPHQVVVAAGRAVGREHDVERAETRHEVEGVVGGPALDRPVGEPGARFLGGEQPGFEVVEGVGETGQVVRLTLGCDVDVDGGGHR